jgi:hypothetical protein
MFGELEQLPPDLGGVHALRCDPDLFGCLAVLLGGR